MNDVAGGMPGDGAMTAKVTIEGGLIRLWSDGRLLDKQHQSSLTRIYEVYAGSDISVANPDTEFNVFSFSDNLWVLPFETEGTSKVLYETWHDHISKSKLYYVADLAKLPQHWRKRWLWGLLRIPEPQLLVLPATDLPDWRIWGPVDPGGQLPMDVLLRRSGGQ